MKKRTRPGAAYDRGVRIAITVAPRVSAMVDDLLATGLFGRTRAEVVQRGFYAFLRDKETEFFWRDPPKPRNA